MENTCRDIVLYTGEQEAVPIVTAAPGHRENIIDVENVPDLSQVHDHFGPIGNPTVRRSRRNRRPTSPAPSSSSPPAKKPRGSDTFPAYFDDDDVPLSRLIPKSGRTSRSAATPTSSTIPSTETTEPSTAMETEPSNPDPNPDPVAVHTFSPPPEPPIGENDSSSDDADFVPSPNASTSESESDNASDAMPDPDPVVRSPSPARTIPSTRSNPSTRRGKPHSTQFLSLAAKVRW